MLNSDVIKTKISIFFSILVFFLLILLINWFIYLSFFSEIDKQQSPKRPARFYRLPLHLLQAPFEHAVREAAREVWQSPNPRDTTETRLVVQPIPKKKFMRTVWVAVFCQRLTKKCHCWNGSWWAASWISYLLFFSLFPLKNFIC